jgi:nucleotide-binding universal stress UspA family protein
MAHTASFRTILVPLDGSLLAEQALPLARRIAERAGSKLRLALVHQIPLPPLDGSGAKLFTSIELASRKAERSYLRALQARLRDQGVRLASAVSLTGAVGPALAQYVQDLGIDLVVMATHGRGGIRRAWLGSIADYMVRHLQVPILLVRPSEQGAAPEPTRGADQILVPLDGSPLAEEALEPAAELARAWGAELTLLQVVYPVVFMSDEMLGFTAPYDEDLTARLRTQAEDHIRGQAERLRGQGLRATGVAVIGWSAADSILQAARPDRVAAIAIATHGRGGIQRLALGSVADKLVRAAEVPVLVHRPAGRQKAAPRKRAEPARVAAKPRRTGTRARTRAAR